MRDLRARGVDILTLGQYLRPSPRHLPILRYVSPQEFEELRRAGAAMGFAHVESGPLVRSSYRAAAAFGVESPRSCDGAGKLAIELLVEKYVQDH
jgi:lipoic acid synthetase